ncbi:MAG TPA: multicopper oxidase domain-containing protein [Ktedonobacterales bacterium]|nr:multicopper oxidase domain-containing protein [Ktedonobacterales bacterium]
MSIHPGPIPTREREDASPVSQPLAPISAPPNGAAPATQPGALRKEWDAITRRDATALKHIFVGALSAILVFTVAMGAYAAFTGAPASTAAPSGSSASSASSAKVAQVAVPKYQPYNAQPAAAPSGPTANITLTVKEGLVTIAPNVAYNAWTFDGTIPGPILRVRQGQTVNFTLINDGKMGHSIDFHAAQVAPNVDYRPIPAGDKISFTFTPKYPGVFMYHCGMSPVMDHIANGMYGAIIVDPANGWSSAKEYALVQSEFYTQKGADGSYSLDQKKMMSAMPDYVVFNGYSAQYVSNPLTAKPGEKIRLFIVNAGPTGFSAFHVIGAIFSDYYPDGNPANHMVGAQTITIPPGGGAVVELTIPDKGSYNFVTHSFAAAMSGAIGAIKVG